RHVPDRLPFDTPLYLMPPPRFIVDFSAAELTLIAGMRNGATVESLLRRMEPERKNEGRLVFALLSRRVLALSAREACDPSAWRPVLQQAGILSGLEVDDEPEEVVRLADLAVESAPGAAPPATDREILPPWLSQANPGWTEPPGSRINVPPPVPVAPPLRAPARSQPAAPRAPPAAAHPAAPAAESGEAKRPPIVRSPQAQQHFELGLASAAGGDLHRAIRLLRQALALSPRDPEISQALGQLAFKDRKAPER
ncbi:MAG TPA: tetratricopeptide repeat protein, partial [Anaeromyxobacteraceae bacterium]|nr:tetratricopeptide repeat protein [Anaeromyxobacteraceae bacterium]